MAQVQSNVGGFRTPRTLLQTVAGALHDGTVMPPQFVTANGEVLPASKYNELALIQNVGTNAVKIAFGVQPSEDNYHYILAPDPSGTGYGGTFDCSKVNSGVYCYSTSGSHKLVVTQIVAMEAVI